MKFVSTIILTSVFFFSEFSLGMNVKKPGSFLVKDAQITFNNNGNEGKPWTVTQVQFIDKIGDYRDCAIIGIKYTPDSTESITTECVGPNGMLMRKYGDSDFFMDRPIVENSYLEFVSDNGIRVMSVETKGIKKFTIGNKEYDGIETIITHYDEMEVPLVRLDSYYCVELGTVLYGKNQIPDDEKPGEWKTFNEYTLSKYQY